MITAVLDTTVIIHLFRKNQQALAWFVTQKSNLAITPVTWMEVMVGNANKQAEKEALKLLDSFAMIYLNAEDQDWAMRQMLAYHFSKGVGILDCLNASVCFRLNIPIFTDNVKDYVKILPPNLVIKPY